MEEDAGQAEVGEGNDTPWGALGIVFDNQEHIDRFLIHNQQSVMATRFFDPVTTGRLGFRAPLLELIQRVGFADYIEKGSHKTSRRLTLEFISTVDWVGKPRDKSSEISFRLMNVPFVLSLEELNRHMGWDPESPTEHERKSFPRVGETLESLGTRHPSNFNPFQVWKTIAHGKWHHTSKASAIQHPAFRYLHRMLVYTCFGRTQLGQPAQRDVMALWLGLEPRDPAHHPIINYGEMWIRHWIQYRKSTVARTKLVMGGGVTHLAEALLGQENLAGLTYVSDDTLLNTAALIDGSHIVVGNNRGYHGWLVSGKLWCQLPNTRVGKKFSELRSKERYALPQEECQALAFDPPRITPLPEGTSRRPSRDQAGPSSTTTDSPSQATLDSLQAQITALQIGQNHQTDLLYYMFSQGVASGTYQPYLNFPHYPMQQGPLPGWQNRQPTHPYHPHRPEGIDYRFPGGSDPSFDPNIPPFDPTQPRPDDYHSSVPQMEDTWGSAPMPPWGDYTD